MKNDYKFWDRHAAGYAKRPVADEESYQHKLHLTRGYLRPDMEVLEFGCGTGSTALTLAPCVRHIRATDISDAMLGIARAKAEAANVANVTFERSDVDEPEAADGYYDAVLGHSILHLVRDRKAVIADVYRMLKPGGVFISSTPCLRGALPFLKIFVAAGHYFGLLPAVAFFTVGELERDIIAAGFDIESTWQPGKRKAIFIVAKKPA